MNFKSHVPLGRTGLSVSRLGFGASYPAPADALEKAFHERGVNFSCGEPGGVIPCATL